ncbi:MAG TPA: NPCBM/NEW2 domain-containing protein, partial [Candidatus Paceibacterota bacterium]|nr:NPCBM/NEW2 domain-containing protein [Candidatus Paceibacterota bacterium]
MATLLAAVLLSMTTVASSQSGEFLACRQWADRFLGVSPSASNTPCLKLLFEDVAEGITRGQSWRGTPYQLGTKIYSHGIAFNSTKHILVRLGQPAARFVAEVGLENNDDTRRGAALGNGSVTFHVLARGRELFASPVLRLEDGAVRLDA